MTARRFEHGAGSHACPSCGARTSLYEQATMSGQLPAGDHVCDVCWEAAGYYNSVQDGRSTWEEARREFITYARAEWPTLTLGRLTKCWESN